MAGVSWQLGRTAIVDPLTAGIAVVTLVLLWRTRLNSAWYIGAGALVGLAHAFSLDLTDWVSIALARRNSPSRPRRGA